MKQGESHSDVQILGRGALSPAASQGGSVQRLIGRPLLGAQHIRAVMSKTVDNGTVPSKDCERQQLCLFIANDRGTWTSNQSRERAVPPTGVSFPCWLSASWGLPSALRSGSQLPGVGPSTLQPATVHPVLLTLGIPLMPLCVAFLCSLPPRPSALSLPLLLLRL